LEQRARLLARQGHAFATAQEVRVVYPPGERSSDRELIDVPRDGKTLGEIVTKGNIVMKEVGGPCDRQTAEILVVFGNIVLPRSSSHRKGFSRWCFQIGRLGGLVS
jgi:hypothetical protein